MSVFVCGDTHIPIDIAKLNMKNWPEQKFLTKEDILVVLGDFGLLWEPNWSDEEIYWAKWLTNKPFQVCFIDGNHSNFVRLYQAKEDMFHGGKVGVVYEDENGRILHLKRGEIFTFNNKTVFTFGGAQSTDKAHRIIGRSWWPEEVPNYAECEYALANLEKHGNCVDFILTHTTAFSTINAFNFVSASERVDDPTERFLEEVKRIVQFRQWHFGHFHTSAHIDMKYVCHYNWSPIQII